MFECYVREINIANNKNCKKMHNSLRIELMQLQPHRLRGSLVDSKENIPSLRKRNLEN